MPIDENGFVARTENEILLSAESELLQVRDPISGEFLQNDFASDDPLMQIAKIPLAAVARCEEASKLIYDQFDISNATGQLLSSLVMLNGIRRLEGEKSTFKVKFFAENSTIIPKNSIISTENESHFFILSNDVTVGASLEIEAVVESVDIGNVEIDVSQITKIITPIAGWNDVLGIEQLTIGRFEESDEDLRKRQRSSTSATSRSLIDSLYSNLLNVSGVTYARCYLNQSPTTVDSRGIQPAHLACVVVGGDDEEIAKTIFTRYAMNQTQGDQVVTFYDQQNEPYPIKFYRPEKVVVDVEIEIEIYDQNKFTADGEVLLKNAVIAYAAKGAAAFGDVQGFESGFGVGVDVEASRLYTAANSVAGHRVISIQVKKNSETTLSNSIAINFNQISEFLAENINIVVN